MNDFLRRNPIIAGLAGLCVVLAAVVVVELVALGGRPAAMPARKVVPSEAKLLPSLAAVSPDAAYPETGARPLWIPTRRPAPAAVAAAKQSFTRGQFVLQGVTIAGSMRIAMLKEKASGRMHRVELGRDVNGLHLAEVEPERVTLSQGSEREVIELRPQRPGGAPSGGAPQPAGASMPVPATVTPVPQRSAGGPFAPIQPYVPMPGGAHTTPGAPVPPSGTPPTPQPAIAGQNPAPGAVPQAQPQAATPMSPEELLARRRARRQPTQE